MNTSNYLEFITESVCGEVKLTDDQLKNLATIVAELYNPKLSVQEVLETLQTYLVTNPQRLSREPAISLSIAISIPDILSRGCCDFDLDLAA